LLTREDIQALPALCVAFLFTKNGVWALENGWATPGDIATLPHEILLEFYSGNLKLAEHADLLTFELVSRLEESNVYEFLQIFQQPRLVVALEENRLSMAKVLKFPSLLVDLDACGELSLLQNAVMLELHSRAPDVFYSMCRQRHVHATRMLLDQGYISSGRIQLFVDCPRRKLDNLLRCEFAVSHLLAGTIDLADVSAVDSRMLSKWLESPQTTHDLLPLHDIIDIFEGIVCVLLSDAGVLALQQGLITLAIARKLDIDVQSAQVLHDVLENGILHDLVTTGIMTPEQFLTGGYVLFFSRQHPGSGTLEMLESFKRALQCGFLPMILPTARSDFEITAVIHPLIQQSIASGLFNPLQAWHARATSIASIHCTYPSWPISVLQALALSNTAFQEVYVQRSGRDVEQAIASGMLTLEHVLTADAGPGLYGGFNFLIISFVVSAQCQAAILAGLLSMAQALSLNGLSVGGLQVLEEKLVSVEDLQSLQPERLEILFENDLGLEALRRRLLTLQDIVDLPSHDHLMYFLSREGLLALESREQPGLLTMDKETLLGVLAALETTPAHVDKKQRRDEVCMHALWQLK
jgi:hypothetical protein